MTYDTNPEFRKNLRHMTDEFRQGVRDAAYAAREHALAQAGANDPRLSIVAERLDRELASHKASLAKRFARLGAPARPAAPSEPIDD
jgi:hypothetical protein